MVSRIALRTLSAALLFSVSVTAKVVTADNARNVAQSFLASKGLPETELVYKSAGDPAVLLAPSKDAQLPAFHIFSDKDNKEIIVVSGDDIARPILGWSFNYKADENGDFPPAMMDWLSEMERQISQARKEGVEQSAQVAQAWRAPSTGNVVRQLKTAKWGQNYPFNADCPFTNSGERCITGCVATSYAILMKYHRYPSGAKGYTSTYITPNNGIVVYSRELSTSYDWDSMLMDYSGDFNYNQAMAVAKLMADIGAAIKADYTPQSTSAYYEGGYIYKHFGYHLGTRSYKSNYSVNEWNSKLKEHLDNIGPVLYNAKNEDESSGHSFIIDGYTDQDYFCVNWGWAGSCDGAYALDAMVPYDDPNYTFKGPQCAFFDFKPSLGLPVVAKVNDSIECPSLEAAVAMVPADGKPVKITMTGGCDIDELRIFKNQNIVLDLGGFKIGVVNYGIYNRGDLIIADSKGNGGMVFKTGTSAILNNYGNLTIYGGEYVNQTGLATDDNYYRRCIWTDQNSSTHIIGGRFKAINCVICTNGVLTIDSGEFECTGNDDLIANWHAVDTLTIKGGTFKNLTNNTAEGTNYRRTLWTCEGSVTHITGGVFTCKNPTVLSKGEVIIDNGRFETIGNTSTIYNYSTTAKMTINGGIFVNSLGLKEPSDYRRAFYSVAESQTQINGGKFSSANQVLTVVGNMTINDATIEGTSDGLGILAGGGGNVAVNYCKIKANTMVAITSATLYCYGGLYSKTVTSKYLGSGCQCVSNDDAATSSTYPYKVVNPAGIDNVFKSADALDLHYDLNGMSVPDNTPGIHIIRTADGKTIKVLYR